ncbi:MAG TPA: hypothetical protein VNX65_00205 [Patescibacteria group bacterium]|jgi:hypothetical protein|nr:hypothetical protein [Patescibacteria group bacterium]
MPEFSSECLYSQGFLPVLDVEPGQESPEADSWSANLELLDDLLKPRPLIEIFKTKTQTQIHGAYVMRGFYKPLARVECSAHEAAMDHYLKEYGDNELAGYVVWSDDGKTKLGYNYYAKDTVAIVANRGVYDSMVEWSKMLMALEAKAVSEMQCFILDDAVRQHRAQRIGEMSQQEFEEYQKKHPDTITRYIKVYDDQGLRMADTVLVWDILSDPVKGERSIS